MNLDDFGAAVISDITEHFEEACELVGLPPAAADSLLDLLDCMLEEASA